VVMFIVEYGSCILAFMSFHLNLFHFFDKKGENVLVFVLVLVFFFFFGHALKRRE
jgi:hypothetical protein